MGTFVNNLRLLEITTGDESGTWGTKTNLNLELIADAFGSGTEAITTNADTHTTTIADGAADEGRAIFLKYTGTLDSACTITLAPNTVNKLWFIENATSGSQNIIISQGSGANITIGNGNVAAVYTDGAGSGAAVLDAFADLELSSTLTVAGNVDFNGDLDVDGTTNLDAVDIDGAVQIDSTVTVGVDDTGYDVKFFGATSGAYMLWDESADDLVLAGAAGLDVAGDIDVDGTTNLDVVDIDGAVDMASTLTVAGDVTVDTSTLKVDTSNNRVGVGTASPSANLHTNVTSDGNNLYIDNNGTQLAIGSTSGVNYINTQNGGAGLAFQANGSEKIRLDSSGNVGIGTASPGTLLELKESSNAAGDAVVRLRGHGNNASNTVLGAVEWFNADSSGDQPGVVCRIEGVSGNSNGHMGELVFKTHDGSEGGEGSNPVERMRIDNSGNVGIGTASPANTLHVAASAVSSVPAAGASAHHLAFGSSDYGVAGGALLSGNAYLQVTRWDGTATNYDLLAQPNGGNVVVGRASAAAASTDAGHVLYGAGQHYIFSSATQCVRFYETSGSGQQVGSISITSSATSFNTSSDQRLKDNITDAPSASDDIDAIRIRSFDWKVDGSHQKYGIVAQELIAVTPAAVNQPEDADEMMGIDYSKLVPMLIKEIQSLRDRVASLETN